MSDEYNLSPNMGLLIPVVGQEPGPNWADDLNASLNILDVHNHAPGSGVQINPDGLNINLDLPFNSNNATLLRSTRYSAQASPLSGSSDLGCLYVSGVDLYYNDENGNRIRITQSGSVSGSSGTITGLPSGTASASYSSVSGTFVFQQATSTAANMDVGTLIIRYPGSYPSPSGNYIAIQAPSSLSTGFALTLPAALPNQSNAFMVANAFGTMSYVTVDGTTLSVNAGQIAVTAGGISTAELADDSVTPSKISNNIVVSGSSGAFSTSSTSPTQVTNLSATITTSGGPVFGSLYPDGSGNNSYITNYNGGQIASYEIQRNGTTIAQGNFGQALDTNTIYYPVSSISFVDLSAPAGSNTYTVLVSGNGGGTAVRVYYAGLLVQET